MFEAHPSAFGAFAVDSAMGTGRFGPVFLAHDAAGVAVVVRTFDYAFSPDQHERFTAALAALCGASLEHPSIARPIASGVSEAGRPYVVHRLLPGTPLADFAPASGRRGFDDITNRVTDLAGALDFAAATGVLHGALSPADVILSTESAGVAGLGLVQAFEHAGVPGFQARREDDVAALMTIGRDLLGDRVTPAAATLLTGPPPASALEFADALHRTAPDEVRPDTNLDLWAAQEGIIESFQPEAEPESFRAEVEPASFRPEPQPDSFEVAAEPIDADLRSNLIDSFRHDEEQLAAPLMFGASDAPLQPAPRRRSFGWLMTAALVLGFGILAGFAGAFFIARENPIAAPARHADAPASEATSGQTFSDAPVDEPAPPSVAPAPSPSPVSPPTPAPHPETTPQQTPERRSPPPPARAAEQPRAPRPAPASTTAARRPVQEAPLRSGPAAIRVDSNPAGAQVFVDGRSVGYAPLVVGQLAPGTHSIRMEMPGYRPWVTAVTLAAGARERLAASLEQ